MPTTVRYQVIGTTALAAVLLYLDRICIAEIAKLSEFKVALRLTDQQVGWILSAFFFSYALAQVPAGWLSDRFGARSMLSFYILVWSLCTMATGLATGFFMLLVSRLFFGVAQAGCYPTASSLVRRWTPVAQRGRASSVVSFGGRLGGAAAPLLTGWLLRDWLSWQWVLILYGAAGLLVALTFWSICRETPADHPRCNDAEREFIAVGSADAGRPTTSPFPPLIPLMCNSTMWMMSALQFGVNVGWVFLVTWLPRYLKEMKGINDPKLSGLMVTIILSAGIAGIVAGGPFTDFSVRRWGRRWGRSGPLACCYAIAVVAYLSSPYLDSPWSFVAAASLVAFVSDMCIPAIWAFMQDVGGDHTAAAFGWGNMWGNLGAAVTPGLVPYVIEDWGGHSDWRNAFCLFAGGFLLAGVMALGINPERKIG